MTDQPLSPAAQAVLNAYVDEDRAGRLAVAAALRAAADQASPKLHIEDIDYQHQSYVDGWNDSLELILAIAAELESQ
jgi:hypothetical protein